MARARAVSIAIGGLLGIALAVAALIWNDGRRRSTSAPFVERPRLLPEADGALAHVLLHWVPSLAPMVEPAYGDFLGAIEPDVGVTFVVPEPFTVEQRAVLDAFVSRVDPSGGLARRVQVVPVPGPITTWSKDRALVTLKDGKGLARLIVPAEPSPAWRERHDDWATLERVAQASSGRLRVVVAPFDFDAGDFEVTSDRLIVDTNLLEKNRHRGYSSLDQLTARLGEYFQMSVVGLGSAFGDTPRHHLAMSFTPLGGRLVLVGDPESAARIVGEHWAPGEKSPETDAPFVADFSPDTVARFDRAAHDLEQHGFQVVRIPNVPFDDKTYLSYTNGIFEVLGGRKRAFMPVYGLDALDRAARAVYEQLGWEVIPIRVRSLYPFHGTIGCVVNVLARRGDGDRASTESTRASSRP